MTERMRAINKMYLKCFEYNLRGICFSCMMDEHFPRCEWNKFGCKSFEVCMHDGGDIDTRLVSFLF